MANSLNYGKILFLHHVGIAQHLGKLLNKCRVYKAAGAYALFLLLAPYDHLPLSGEHGEDELDALEGGGFCRGQLRGI